MAVLPLCLALVLQAGDPSLALEAEARAGNAVIKGFVVADQDEALPFAQAILEGESVPVGPLFRISNAHGVFVFRNLPAGRYRLTVFKPGHLAGAPVRVKVRPDDYREVLQRLKTAPAPPGPAQVLEGVGVVQGYVIHEGGLLAGSPAPSAEVLLSSESGGMGTLIAATDSAGFFRFPAVPVGVYRLTARSEGRRASGQGTEIRLFEGGSVEEAVLHLRALEPGGGGDSGRVRPEFPAARPERDVRVVVQ